MNALEVKLHRQRLDKAVRRFRRIALAAAWNKWREAALARRRYVVIIAKCHSRVTSGTLSRAFRAWCGEARATRRRTGVLRKAIFKLANRKTASAFAAWKQGVAEAVTRKRVLDMSLRRMRSVALASAFGHWAGVTNSANRQGEHEALVSDKKLLSRVRFRYARSEFARSYLAPHNLSGCDPLCLHHQEVCYCEWGPMPFCRRDD